MSSNFHTPYIDGTTRFRASEMNAPLGEFDTRFGKSLNRVVNCLGTISFAASTGVLTWTGDIAIYFTNDAGSTVRNDILSSTKTLTAGQAAYVTLNETTGTNITVSVATLSSLDLTVTNRVILGYREATGGTFYPVALKTTAEFIKNNTGASAAPGATDDSASGYAVGSRWIDTTADKEYICLDSTTSAAVWTETTVVTFSGLTDTPANFTDHGGKVAKVNSGETAIEFVSMPEQQTASYSATIAVDVSDGDVVDITLTGSPTVNLSGAIDGQQVLLRVRQDTTGSRVITWGTMCRFSTDIPSPTLSTAGDTLDYIAFRYDATDSKYDCMLKNFGF